MSSKKRTEGDPVKPQVIELGPEDVVVEPIEAADAVAEHDDQARPGTAQATPGARNNDAPRAHRRSSYLFPIAALIAGALGGGWLYRDVLASYFPSPEVTQLVARLDAAEKTVTSANDRISALEQRTGTLQAQINDTSASTSSDLDEVKASSRAAGQRIEQIETALAAVRKQGSDLQARISSIGSSATTGPAVSQVALDELRVRLDAAEKELAAIKSAPPQQSRAAELAKSLTALRQAALAGKPFTAELNAISAALPAMAIDPEMKLLSSSGAPDAAALARDLDSIAGTMQPTGTSGGQESAGWFMSKLSSLVTVRAINETDWQKLASVVGHMAASGNLGEAIQVIEKANGTLPQALADWRDRAARRMKLETSLTKFSDTVMQSLSSIE
jgi:hypothetical protein